jgi:hypothetical protein
MNSVQDFEVPMKMNYRNAGVFAGLLAIVAATGCRTDYGAGSPYQPGPVVGKTVGNAAGVVAGNVAGLGVGAVEGAVHGVASTIDPSYRTVTVWQTVTNSDGRISQVPHDILVDQYGRPAVMPAPTGNAAPK